MVRHNQECPDCGSQRALTDYGDHTHCHKCLKTTYPEEQEQEEYMEEHAVSEPVEKQEHVDTNVSPQSHGSKITPLAKNFPPLEDRGISSEAAAKYQVRAVLNDEIKNVRHVYPYFDQKGTHVGNKCRTRFEKSFFIEGNLSKSALFGQQAFPAGGKSLTIVEGECDAMAAYQMFGCKYPVVSVKSSSVAAKNIQENYQYVTSFDEIVLCLDNDETGVAASKEIAALLPLGKTRILSFQEGKDANEYLQKGKTKEFVKEWWSAPKYSPVGLKFAHEMWDEVRKIPDYESVPYPWEGLNEKTYGIRLSELVTITADPKIGKTSILREVIHNISNKTDSKIGLMFLEEPNRDTLMGLMSVEASKPLHLPDIRASVTDEELKAYFDKVYNGEKFIVWDHWGSNEIQRVLDYVRYMSAMGCKYIILDHISIIVSDQHGDERKQLDEIATKLKQLTMELNISIIVVVHQNRAGQIRGTMGIEQLSNLVIKLYRNKKADTEEERNTMKVSVEDNRFCGRTGPACLLRYDEVTGRMNELPKDALEEFLNKDKTEEW